MDSSCKCFGFVDVDEALMFAEKSHVDVAFLDIKLRGYTGLELSLKLKQLQPNLNIIFATGYNQYMHHAMKQRCSGYIIKLLKFESSRSKELLAYICDRPGASAKMVISQ